MVWSCGCSRWILIVRIARHPNIHASITTILATSSTDLGRPNIETQAMCLVYQCLMLLTRSCGDSDDLLSYKASGGGGIL